MKRSDILIIVIAVAATTLISVVSAYIIRGGIYETTLSDITLRETIGRSLEPVSNTQENPEDRNYTIRDEKYFENREWVIATVADTSSNKAEPAIVIMQSQNNIYTTVLGPGTSFPKNIVDTLPQSVKDYLNANNLVFES